MKFNKKKTKQITIDINEIKNYVLENCEPNVKDIMFSERETVKFSISDTGYREELPRKDGGNLLIVSEESDSFQSLSKTQAKEALEKAIKESFSASLMQHIIEKDIKNVYVYKKAQIDRKLFSKIISQTWYSPSKDTAISLAIALELDLEQTNNLLSKAGYTLSKSIKKDLIVAYFINKEIYDIDTINDTLYRLDERPLGRQ